MPRHSALPALRQPDSKPLDGVNLLPFVTGKAKGRAARAALLAGGPSARRASRRLEAGRRFRSWAIRCCSISRTTLGNGTNLAATNPDKLKELQAAFAEWERGTQPAKWVRQDRRNAEIGGTLNEGDLSPTPRRRTPAAGRIDEAFRNADKNKDGKLSREEYPQPGVFDAVDANKDGFATPEEVRTYYRNRKGN